MLQDCNIGDAFIWGSGKNGVLIGGNYTVRVNRADTRQALSISVAGDLTNAVLPDSNKEVSKD